MKLDQQSVLIPKYVTPARRHKCEKCFSVFECHLCGIGETHTVHSGIIVQGPLYLCAPCLTTSPGLRRIKINLDDRHRNRWIQFDLLTGKKVGYGLQR